ncbi:MAG: 2-amino-4-hydroxy-6-hydroxymethyldihydropteridine diphosphokinase [Arenicella sp.]|jgi:2-amino-4-hydroxy-6-hydroxymethyldihydropteridine diphosphokinase
MSLLTTAYVGVGTNLGDRIQNLIDARQQLCDLPQVEKLKCSSFYLSSPVGYLQQPDFINCVVELTLTIEPHLKSELSPQLLFSQMQKIELGLGRVRDSRNQNAARIIDLDLLSFGDCQSNEPSLILPHPRICDRLFVLLPLIELNPDVTLPEVGSLNALLSKKQLHGDFGVQQIYRLVS